MMVGQAKRMQIWRVGAVMGRGYAHRRSTSRAPSDQKRTTRAVSRTKMVARRAPCTTGRASTTERTSSRAPLTCVSSTPSNRVTLPRRRKPPTVLIRVGPGYPACTTASTTRLASASDRIAHTSFINRYMMPRVAIPLASPDPTNPPRATITLGASAHRLVRRPTTGRVNQAISRLPTNNSMPKRQISRHSGRSCRRGRRRSQATPPNLHHVPPTLKDLDPSPLRASRDHRIRMTVRRNLSTRATITLGTPAPSPAHRFIPSPTNGRVNQATATLPALHSMSTRQISRHATLRKTLPAPALTGHPTPSGDMTHEPTPSFAMRRPHPTRMPRSLIHDRHEPLLVEWHPLVVRLGRPLG